MYDTIWQKDQLKLATENEQIPLGKPLLGRKVPHWSLLEEFTLVQLMLKLELYTISGKGTEGHGEVRWNKLVSQMNSVRHARLFSINVCQKHVQGMIQQYKNCCWIFERYSIGLGGMTWTPLGQGLHQLIEFVEKRLLILERSTVHDIKKNGQTDFRELQVCSKQRLKRTKKASNELHLRAKLNRFGSPICSLSELSSLEVKTKNANDFINGEYHIGNSSTPLVQQQSRAEQVISDTSTSLTCFVGIGIMFFKEP
jgi:hypothetical protein